MCIFNSFPQNFNSSIGRSSNPQLFLFFACLSTLFNSSIVIMSLLSSITSLLLSCSFFTLAPLLIPEFSVVFFPFCFRYRVSFEFISCTCSCLNILKPRLCVPVMSISNVLTNLSQSSLLCLRVIFLTIARYFCILYSASLFCFVDTFCS